MNDKTKPDWREGVSGVTKIGANLSVIIGIVIGLVQIVSLSTSAKSTLNGVQLQSLEHIEKILKEDQKIRKSQRFFFIPVRSMTKHEI